MVSFLVICSFRETYLTIKWSNDIIAKLYNRWLFFLKKLGIRVEVDDIITIGSSGNVGQYMIYIFKP